MDRNIRIVHPLKQVCGSYWILFKELKGEKQLPITMFLQREEEY